jgi:hypothetical protein
MKLLFLIPGIFAPPNDDPIDIAILLRQQGSIAFLKSSGDDLCEKGWKFDGTSSCIKVK